MRGFGDACHDGRDKFEVDARRKATEARLL